MSYIEDWEKQCQNEELEAYIRARAEARRANPGPIVAAALGIVFLVLVVLTALFVWLARAYS